MKEKKTVMRASVAVIVLVLIIGAILLTQILGKNNNILKKDNPMTKEESMKKLDNLYSKLYINKLPLKQDPNFQGDDEGVEKIAVLPDISEYPFIVNPTTDDFLTVYSSVEKSGWFIDIANKFNQSGITVDGKPVSVGIRAIPSSLGVDLITSGKYTPDIYAPSSEIYGDLLISQGINAKLAEKRIAGNVVGVVMTKQKSDELTNQYGNPDSKNIIDSVLNNNLTLGYTTPLSDENGFHFILTLLSNFDNNNLLSEESIINLRKFQDNIILIAYDNDQLRAALTGGTLDAIILDYQTYSNSAGLNSLYEFTPIGDRKDNPVYEIGDLPAIKKQITEKFIDFCKTEDSQKSASDNGFNGLNDYSGATSFKGITVLQAQEIYKKEKNGSSDITAVFVADISGSMEDSPILNLKASLYRAIGVIDSNANIGLVTFSDEVNIAVPIAKFDNVQRSYFSNAVKNMTAGGGTAMFDAIVVAQKMLMDAKDKNPNTKLMLFVLTDGESNRGYIFEDIETMTRGLRIPIYTIGYNANIEILRKLSDINEAPSMNADSDNIIYRIESLFKSQT
ncbi:MAG: VWA domain-containing protein [Oscillospiraceae bacterium]|nr:VWA domain-containing protein [Oscillospiraceae bacterium]